MPRRKKKFPCGHGGYGQACHRCKQRNSQKLSRQREKEKWQETFSGDSVDLRTLPKNVVLKARSIISRLEKQQDYRSFRGKRLRHDRFVISIPVTRKYRLLCRDLGNLLIPEEVISHEEYNVRKPGSSI